VAPPPPPPPSPSNRSDLPVKPNPAAITDAGRIASWLYPNGRQRPFDVKRSFTLRKWMFENNVNNMEDDTLIEGDRFDKLRKKVYVMHLRLLMQTQKRPPE
jgi:hypothetical protein